jgi:hypothetical protein
MQLHEVLNGENGFYFFREEDRKNIYYISDKLIYKTNQKNYMRSIELKIPIYGIEEIQIFLPSDNIFNLKEIMSNDWIKTPDEYQIMLCA